MTEIEVRRDERERVIRVIESTEDYYTSSSSGYVEKMDLKSHMKETILRAVRSMS